MKNPSLKGKRMRALTLAVVVVAGVAGPAVWLATVIPVEGFNFPSDDAWIHQVFARNIASSGMFAYNPGERSSGVTAPLWTMVMSELRFFRVPVVAGGVAATVLAHVLWMAAIYWLALGIWPGRSPWWGAAAATLLSLFGPVIWFSLSGMETSLFFALATLAAGALARKRHALAGFFGAATVPLRPEGALVVALLFGWWVIELIRGRRRPSAGEVVGYVAMPMLFGIPYLAHNLAAGGVIFPTTYYGRHWLYLGTTGTESKVVWKGPLILAYYWYRYIHVWTLGQNDISDSAKIFTDPLVLAQLGLWVAVIMMFRRKLNAGFAFFIVWIFAHNIFYGLFLPNFGTAGRYEGCNYALFTVGIVFGAMLLTDWLKDKALRVIPYVFVASSFVAIFGSYLAWRDMYADNIYHITNVHEAAGKWVASNLPADARIAAFDIGAFGYFANRYIVDLGGLVERDAGENLRAGTTSLYMKKKGVDYIAMMEIESPDIKPLGERLGFYRDYGQIFEMEFIKSWELPMDRRRWINITAIAYPTLNLYRAHFK
jgi:hypothetical protein